MFLRILTSTEWRNEADGPVRVLRVLTAMEWATWLSCDNPCVQESGSSKCLNARAGNTFPFLLVSISKHFFVSAPTNRPKGKPLNTAPHVHLFTNPNWTNPTYSGVSGESGRLVGWDAMLCSWIYGLPDPSTIQSCPRIHWFSIRSLPRPEKKIGKLEK
jgi:hypothetical protein